jgi:hypothetical protein
LAKRNLQRFRVATTVGTLKDDLKDEALRNALLNAIDAKYGINELL